jgi:hypothetical protein
MATLHLSIHTWRFHKAFAFLSGGKRSQLLIAEAAVIELPPESNAPHCQLHFFCTEMPSTSKIWPVVRIAHGGVAMAGMPVKLFLSEGDFLALKADFFESRDIAEISVSVEVDGLILQPGDTKPFSHDAPLLIDTWQYSLTRYKSQKR